MAYVDPDYKTKKEFIAAVKAGRLHYPKPHRWYSSVVVKDGIVISGR